MYKILLIPEDVFITSFVKQGKEMINTSFRKLAIMVHPDKNHHPHSKTAFLKLAKIFNEAKTRF